MGLWAVIVGAWVAAFWWDAPVGFAALFVFMGPMFARLAILAHEAAHRNVRAQPLGTDRHPGGPV